MTRSNYAPIVLFGFIRLDTIKKVVEGLLANTESKDSDLFIFIDGPRKESEALLVEKVYKYCHQIDGFKNITIHANEYNKGLDPSIIDGVTTVINKYGKVIVLEDDVVPTSNFLSYMNTCLDVFESDERIMSIGGYGLKVKKPKDYTFDAYLFGRSVSWGWATWIDRWSSIDWEIKDWCQFRKNLPSIYRFNKRAGSDMFSMLKACMRGGNMWDIRFCYNMYKQNKYCVTPIISKTNNIGFNELAIHCKPIKYQRYKINFDLSNNKLFKLAKGMPIHKGLIRQNLFVHSYFMRIVSKTLNKIL